MSKLNGCISPKADWFVVGVERQLKLLDLTGRRVAVVSQERLLWQAVACASDGKRIAAVGTQSERKSVLGAWRYSKPRLEPLWKKPLDFEARWVACSDTVVAVASSETLLTVRWANGETISQVRLPQPVLAGHLIDDVVWLGDERGNLWRVQNREARKVANFGVGEIFCIDSVHPLLYLGCADTLIHTYDLSRSQPGPRLLGHQSEVGRLCCAPQRMVSVGFQGDASWWNLTDQYPERRLILDGAQPESVALAPEGNACWVLLANGLYQINWSQPRAKLVVAREQITNA